MTDVFGACREARLATMLSDTANYGNNHKTLQSSEKINVDTANATKLIQGAIDSMWMPANTMIISRLAFSALRQNPFIVKAVNKNSGDSGIASLEGIKDLFQLDRILVGKSMANTAKRNQTASYVNIWGNDIILAYINPNATLDNGVTFGLKAERGEREISTGFDAKRGVRGVEYIKIANEEKDLIVCPDCGYLLKGVI